MTRELLPRADVVLDFHSGGKTLDFLPFAACHILPDKAQEARARAAVEAFAAPFSMKMLEIDAVGMFDTTAEAPARPSSPPSWAAAAPPAPRPRRSPSGASGTSSATPPSCRARPSRAPVALDMPSADCFVFSKSEGLVEPLVDLGEAVKAGDLLAQIHPSGRLGRTPAEYRAHLDGILAARHFPGLIGMGDCLAVVASVVGR